MMKTFVDVPLAMADGLHNVPMLYGEEVRDLGPVRGWKSGGAKGLKVCFSPLYCFSYSFSLVFLPCHLAIFEDERGSLNVL